MKKKIKVDEKILKKDLSNLIGSKDFKKVSFSFEMQSKDKSVTLRMSSEMLLVYKKKAKAQGVSYQKLMRFALENFLKQAS